MAYFGFFVAGLWAAEAAGKWAKSERCLPSFAMSAFCLAMSCLLVVVS